MDNGERVKEPATKVDAARLFTIQELWRGGCVSIGVPDLNSGKSLVEGDTALVRVGLKDYIESHGEGGLKSKEITFQIIDFTQPQNPLVILEEATGKIPELFELNPGEKLVDYYPGRIIVIIGGEQIPTSLPELRGLGRIAKYAPSIFINSHKMDLGGTNRIFSDAIGANQMAQFKIET